MSEPRKKKRLQITGNQRFRVLERDAFRCAYCGIPSSCAILEVDHITPIADGGTNSSLNLAACCADCNAGKGSMAIPLDQLPEVLARRQAEHDMEQNRIKAAFVAGRLFDPPVPHVDEWIRDITYALADYIHIDVLVRMVDEVRSIGGLTNKQRMQQMRLLITDWYAPDSVFLRGLEGCDDIEV